MDKFLENRVNEIIQRYEPKEFFWFIKNSQIEPIIQSGPQCGIVALCMALNSVNINCKVDILMNRARELNYSKSGEIFDIKFLANLAQEYSESEIKSLSSIDDEYQILDFILENKLLLIAYDCDLNFEPCFKQGLKAHWALITGAIIPIDNAQSTNFVEQNFETNLVYHQTSIEEEKIKIIKQFSNLDGIHVICRHGKSKYSGVWSLKKLVESNKQLNLIDNKKCDHENYIKPEHGDLSQTLANKILILKNK